MGGYIANSILVFSTECTDTREWGINGESSVSFWHGYWYFNREDKKYFRIQEGYQIIEGWVLGRWYWPRWVKDGEIITGTEFSDFAGENAFIKDAVCRGASLDDVMDKLRLP